MKEALAEIAAMNGEGAERAQRALDAYQRSWDQFNQPPVTHTWVTTDHRVRIDRIDDRCKMLMRVSPGSEDVQSVTTAAVVEQARRYCQEHDLRYGGNLNLSVIQPTYNGDVDVLATFDALPT